MVLTWLRIDVAIGCRWPDNTTPQTSPQYLSHAVHSCMLMLMLINCHWILFHDASMWMANFVRKASLLLNFVHQRIQKENVAWFPTKILSSAAIFNVVNKMKNKNWVPNPHIRRISEGSCDKEDWSNAAENSALHHRKLHCKIKIITVLYFWSNKCSHGEHVKRSKTLTENLTNPKLLKSSAV